ncbi:MAG TPA: extracellular solute-binding protein [Rectinemataceae bacterium]|nr:extracellular solute-binding protein [Rectinemataceae bacterium]
MKKRWFIALVVAAVFASGLMAQGKKLTVWCWDPNFNVYAMKEAAKVYNKTHPDVNIEIVDMAQDIEAKIISGLQAGGAGLPDIALFQDFRIEQFLQDYPNAFVDLKAAGVDYSKFAAYKVGPMTVGNHVYGIPFDTGSTGLWLRTDYIKAAGLNPDNYMGKNLTWADVIKLGVAVKAKTGKPLLAYQSDNFDMLRIVVQSTGGQFFSPDGSLNLRSDAFKKSLTLFKELNDKGLLYPVVGWSDWINAINSDQSAGFLNAIWMVGSVKSRPENKGKYMVIPTPKIEGVAGASNASNNGGSSWYVFSSSPNKALAVDFLKSVWATTTPDTLAFYNSILKGAGAMGTYLPSQSGSNYTAKDDFFYKDQSIYKDFATWMAKVPVLKYTPNYVPMRDAVAHATLNYFQGKLTTVDATIAAAESEYKQVMGQ